jgi:hypothetical protein
LVSSSSVFFASVVFVVARGELDWGPVQQYRRLDSAVSAERTLTSTVRRVGTAGRIDEKAA